MILISNDFCHKRKMYNFDAYNVLLSNDTCAAYDWCVYILVFIYILNSATNTFSLLSSYF